MSSMTTTAARSARRPSRTTLSQSTVTTASGTIASEDIYISSLAPLCTDLIAYNGAALGFNFKYFSICSSFPASMHVFDFLYHSFVKHTQTNIYIYICMRVHEYTFQTSNIYTEWSCLYTYSRGVSEAERYSQGEEKRKGL